MNISVIGAGYVGLVTAGCMAEMGHDVVVMDSDSKKIEKLRSGIIPIHEPGLDRIINKNSDKIVFTDKMEEVVRLSGIHFICVWTPPKEDGEADLSAVKAVSKNLADEFVKSKSKFPIVVTKSTVPVGTHKIIKEIIKEIFKGDFDVVSNPEFLREGQAVADMLRPDRIVVGSESLKAAEDVASLYLGLRSSIIITDAPTSEMIKYAANAFLATKISFINEVANVCELVGADVSKVAEAVGADKRIGKYFLNAGMGYGGSCFPKDVRALFHFSNAKGYDFKLLKSVIEVNEQQRKLVIAKLEKIIGNLKGKNILVLGLAFKSSTDDVRESGAIDIINRLVKKGANVTASDPLALLSAKKILDSKIEYSAQPEIASKEKDAIIIATEWPQFKTLNWSEIRSNMKNPVVVDGRNILNPKEMKDLGFKYDCIGRGGVA